MENMRLIITNMGRQIKSLMKDSTEVNEDNETYGGEVVEIANESISEETEVIRKSEVWLHCEMCVYWDWDNHDQAYKFKTQGIQVL